MLPRVRRLFGHSDSSVVEAQNLSDEKKVRSSTSEEETQFRTETFVYVVQPADSNSTQRFEHRTTNLDDEQPTEPVRTPKISNSVRNLISLSNPFRRLNNILRSEFKSNQSASTPAIHDSTFSAQKPNTFSLKSKRSKSMNPDLNEVNHDFPPPPAEFLSQETISSRQNRNFVRAYGPGLFNGLINSNNYFDLVASLKDLQNVSISIDGPSKVSINIEPIEDELYRVHYRCSWPGKYRISITNENEHIHGSPYSLSLGDRSSQDIFGLHSTDAMRVYIEPIEFDMKRPSVIHVYPSSSCHVFQAYIQTAQKNLNLPIIVHKSAKSEIYEVYFHPSKAGYYWLNIHLNYLPVLNSPIRLTVRRSSSTKQIHHDEMELFRGYVGELSQFFVSKSPPNQSPIIGHFSVSIDGPSPVTLDSTETEFGYEVFIRAFFTFQCKPTRTGQYQISIRNSGEHIEGSPLILRVDDNTNDLRRIDDIRLTLGSKCNVPQQNALSMIDNASKVCVFGSGLYEARKRRKASFKIDASHAGPGLLLVGLQSCVGTYERLVIKKLKPATSDFVFKVSYRVKNSGQYLLSILYGLNMQHVPGSPYSIVVD